MAPIALGLGAAESEEAAEIHIDLVAYWKREETEVRTETRHSAVHESHAIDVTELREHHQLRAVVTIREAQREMTAAEVKKNGGSVKGAAHDLLEQLSSAI